MTKRRKTSWSV